MARSQKNNIKVPYALSIHDEKEALAVARVINEHRTLLGKETSAFEQKVARLFGKTYGVMVNSGSSANLLAFEILNLPHGSEVITPVLTFNTTVAPLIQKGLVPVFIDAKPASYLIDIDQIEKRITKKTKALMIPSLIGNIPDMRRLRRIADSYGLYFIEDSCDTIGATFNAKPTGAWSDISTTSFYGSHVINAAGGGGMICVNRKNWHQRLLVLRGWGRTSALFEESENLEKRFTATINNIPYDNKFIYTELGYNFLPLEISAAFGLAQLQKLPRFTMTRQKNFAQLLSYFSRWTRFFDLPAQTPRSTTNWLAFPLTIKEGSPFSRIELVTFLEKNGIQTRPVFGGNILHQPVFSPRPASHAGYAILSLAERSPLIRLAIQNHKQTPFPVADRIMRQAFLIGCHQGLAKKELAHLTHTFETFLKRYAQQKNFGGSTML